MAGNGQMLKEIAVDDKENFTAEQIQKFHDDEEFYQKFVRSIEKDTGSNFQMVWLPVYLLCPSNGSFFVKRKIPCLHGP